MKVTRASKRSVGCRLSGAARKSPGWICSFFRSGRFRATRLPAGAASTGWPCICTLRMREVRPLGSTSATSPGRAVPLQSVPVTTVPAPLMVNTRSMGKRNCRPNLECSVRAAAFCSAQRSSSRPAPVRLEQGTMSAFAYGVSASHVRISSDTKAIHSSSTRSVLVKATTRVFTPKVRSTARCSMVCGMMPSSAAMTSRARSMPVEPAIIWRTKCSWPGTSTTPTAVPSGSFSCANPSSMVMPRFFSSANRSGSVPVRARTNEDLPWSMCPAVPSTTLGAGWLSCLVGIWTFLPFPVSVL